MNTRQDLERELEKKYLNQNVAYKKPNNKVIYGKVDRISVVWEMPIVIGFIIDRKQYEVDPDYLNENLVIL